MMQLVFSRKLVALAAAAVLAACSSGVPLDEPAAAGAGGSGGAVASGVGAAGAAASSVEGVQLDGQTQGAVAGPQGYSRVIYFDYDSFTIRADAQADIAAHAQFLRAQPALRASLEGHTDERGGREYNLALGDKRAQAVRKALALLGVADAQMEAVSFGEEKPMDASGSENAHAKNRRVEIVYK